MILAWTGDELSHGQARGYRTHRRTDRQTQPTTIPENQNWPRVKMICDKIMDIKSANGAWPPCHQVWDQSSKRFVSKGMEIWKYDRQKDRPTNKICSIMLAGKKMTGISNQDKMQIHLFHGGFLGLWCNMLCQLWTWSKTPDWSYSATNWSGFMCIYFEFWSGCY